MSEFHSRGCEDSCSSFADKNNYYWMYHNFTCTCHVLNSETQWMRGVHQLKIDIQSHTKYKRKNMLEAFSSQNTKYIIMTWHKWKFSLVETNITINLKPLWPAELETFPRFDSWINVYKGIAITFKWIWIHIWQVQSICFQSTTFASARFHPIIFTPIIDTHNNNIKKRLKNGNQLPKIELTWLLLLMIYGQGCLLLLLILISLC